MNKWTEFGLFVLLICVCCGSRLKNVTLAVKRQIRSVGFPEGSAMGIFFAVGIPLDIPDKSVSLSFYFEANYMLPNDKNSTYFGEYFGERSLSRKVAYQIIQNKFESAGYPGRECLLRAICEASRVPLTENGLIGDILHIFFTPSTSKSENLPPETVNAEYVDNCQQYCKCPISILELISDFHES